MRRMSDIVIRGIEMSKKCLGSLTGVGDCFIVGKCKTFQNTVLNTKDKIAWDDRLPNCPLVELPEPHGDLIDRDKLAEEFEKYEIEEASVFDILFDAPTVLEASEE